MSQLYVYTGNQTENLFERGLISLIKVEEKPFQRFVFLVQGRGMERWLQQRLSEHFGVWMSGEFPFPQSFFDELAAKVDTRLNGEHLHRDAVRWRIEALLRQPEFVEDPLLKPLLSRGGSDKRRFQLAEQVANLFDQYQIFRPDWLDDWTNGKNPVETPHADWQMRLWQALELKPHRGQLWLQLIEALNASKPGSVAGLPSQVFAFGISFMPPLMLQTLQALSRHVPVHLFMLSPTSTFWADLPSKKEREAMLEQSEALSDLEMAYHPLLLSMGRQGAHFQHLLLDADIARTFESFETPDEDNLLAQLQRDLEENRVPTEKRTGLKENLLFHRCHTPQREVEVLRDRVVTLLEEDDTLSPNDIVVMAPDLKSYRPFIETLFADIPHTIADRSLETEAPALKLLNDWFSLIQGRLDWDEVFGFLYQPEVQSRLNLSAQQLETLYDVLIEQGQVRWGLSGEDHRNHWRDGFQRVVLGTIMHAPDTLWRGKAPMTALEGQSIQQLTPMLSLFEKIERWQTLSQQVRPMVDWERAIRDLADFFYAGSTDRLPLDEALNALIEETQSLEQAEYALETLSSWANSLGAERRSSSGFLSRGITFCDLLPMRSIPIKVVFLLGMNDRSYPRMHAAPDFDLFQYRFRIGDRDQRAEDRYTFLELLLSVRDRLEILWQGISADKNEPQPPAQVVLELMEVMKQTFGAPQLERLIYTHKAYPFHTAYFEAQPEHSNPQRLLGRWPQDFTICDRLHHADKILQPLWQQPLNWEEEVLPIETLSEALADPVKWALQQAGIRLPKIDLPPEAREKLSVNGLDKWALRDAIKGDRPFEQLNPTLARKKAEGSWPLEVSGEKEARDAADIVQRIWTLLEAKAGIQAGLPKDEEILSLKMPEVMLTYTSKNRYENGQIIFHPHRLKGKRRLSIWLSHLFLNACLGNQTTWVGYQEQHYRNKEAFPAVWRLFPLGKEEAQAALQAWLALFKQVLTQPPVWHADWMADWLMDKKPDSAEKKWFDSAELATGLKSAKYNGKGADEMLTFYLRHLDDEAIREALQQGYDGLLPVLEAWQSYQERID